LPGHRGYALIATAAVLAGSGIAVAARGHSQQPPPPLGTAPLDSGMGTASLQGHSHRVTLRLSPRAAQTLRGSRLRLHCRSFDALGQSRFLDTYIEAGDTSSTFRLGKRQRVVQIRMLQFTRRHTPPFCTLLEPGRAQWIKVVDIPLTQEGADYLDAARAAEPLAGVLGLLVNRFVDRLPSTDELIQTAPNEHPIPLSQPSDTPPPGVLGVWGDGHNHVALVVTSRLGRRLFVEINGTQWTTNVPGILPQ
jgi:hypothetical protein